MSRPRLGVSACFFHADSKRNLFKGKTLLYAEESMLHWLMAGGAVPMLLPRAGGGLTPADLLDGIDGLVLQGGSDMSPRHYGEEPLRPEWEGDPARDLYEMELVRLCLAADKPVLGVCRGAQVLNVALGGSLYQDLETLHPERHVHRNWEVYDQHGHEIEIEAGSLLGRWYAALQPPPRVNSVHHQGLKTLGRGLVVEARSIPDGVIEAVRYDEEGPGSRPFAYGVQWHPEFIKQGEPGLLDPQVLLAGFLEQVTARRAGREPLAVPSIRKSQLA
jgi:putative glutamine amidotransferase